MHQPIPPAYAKAYQEMLLQEGLLGNRLSGNVKAARPRLRDRLLVSASNHLIASGKRLRQYARPAVSALPEPCAQVSGKASA